MSGQEAIIADMLTAYYLYQHPKMLALINYTTWEWEHGND
jgi:hypothetical protein